MKIDDELLHKPVDDMTDEEVDEYLEAYASLNPSFREEVEMELGYGTAPRRLAELIQRS